MPQPTLSDVHVDRPLQDISVAFQQDPNDYVATKVFPVVPVQKKSDKIFTYEKGLWFRNQAKKRAPGTESQGTGFNLNSNLSYNADTFAIHQDVPWENADNSDAPINLESDAATYLMQLIMIAQEVDWTSAFFTTSIWTGSSTGSDITVSNKWDTAAGDPVVDIRKEIRSVKRKTAQRPMKLVLSRPAWDAIQDNPNVLDRIGRGSTTATPSILTRAQFAALLEIDEVLVADAVQNTAKEGADDVFDFIAGKDALIVFTAPAPSILKPSGGYSFTWTGKRGATQGVTTKRFEMPKKEATRIENEMSWDFKLIEAQLGAFFDAVVS